MSNLVNITKVSFMVGAVGTIVGYFAGPCINLLAFAITQEDPNLLTGKSVAIAAGITTTASVLTYSVLTNLLMQ